MTLNELEVLIRLLQRLVELNTLAIASFTDSLKNYTTSSSFYQVSTKVNNQDTTINTIYNDVAKLTVDLSKINRIASLIDTNITNVAGGDILVYDGDRWTNVKAMGIVGGGGINKLEDLSDVNITNKSNGLVLSWDNFSSKWINVTNSGSGGSGGGLDVSLMWAELAKSDVTRKIHASHYTDVVMQNNGTANNLNVAVLTTTGNINMTNGANAAFNLSTAGTSINGNLTATGEVTAYK